MKDKKPSENQMTYLPIGMCIASLIDAKNRKKIKIQRMLTTKRINNKTFIWEVLL